MKVCIGKRNKDACTVPETQHRPTKVTAYRNQYMCVRGELLNMIFYDTALNFSRRRIYWDEDV